MAEAKSYQGITTAANPFIHYQIFHPNFMHAARDQVSVDPEGEGFSNFIRGRARNHPEHSAPGGLHIPVRK